MASIFFWYKIRITNLPFIKNRPAGKSFKSTNIKWTETTKVPCLLTIACKERQVYHQKNPHLIGLTTTECILWVQGEPSSVYPLQAEQWLVRVIVTTNQSQWPAKNNYHQDLIINLKLEFSIKNYKYFYSLTMNMTRST